MSTLDTAPPKVAGVDSARRGERFALLDAFRGLAAMGIACYHIYRYGPLPAAAEPVMPWPIGYMLDHGWMGLQFFFVIAGFVAAYSLRSARLTPAQAGNFMLRRVLRLGTPYWVIVLAVASLNLVAMRVLHDDSLAGQVTWAWLGAQLLFLQDILGFGNVSAGLWFVAIDLQLGLLFVTLVGAAQWLRWGRPAGSWQDQLTLLAATVPLAALALFRFNLDSDQEPWIWYFFHMSAFGAVTWWTLEGRLCRPAFWGFLGLMLAGLAVAWRTEVLLAALAGTTFYLAGRWGWLHLSGGPVLQYLGRISYSLFLVHYPVSWIVVTLGYYLTGTRPVAAVGWLALATAASLAAAQVFYTWVEAPATRLVQRLKAHDTRGVVR